MQSQVDIDDALIAQFLGSRYLGRRYLRYAELAPRCRGSPRLQTRLDC
jgi:hypothetical protein